MKEEYDIAIIGGGPAGLAAAIEVDKQGLVPIIIERESRAGGILKQCIHEGFGLQRFKERLTGPEYTGRFLKSVLNRGLDLLTSTYVSNIKKEKNQFAIKMINESGISYIRAKALILANGCRERTGKQIFIHGQRPAGVFTAGTAQYFVNILGYLPCKRCVILGSGDIGLIMARRLTLEGAEVVGVYEIKDKPSGLTRNVVQCLEDFNIPLYLNHTITEVHGSKRVDGVTLCEVDHQLKPIKGKEEFVPCDGVILSVGLIPENEIAKSLKVELDKHTNGPYVDQGMMTKMEGIFSCGNALHVNDLVDYVSESAEIAAQNACFYIKEKTKRELVPIEYDDEDFLYVVPQLIDRNNLGETIFYFRSRDECGGEVKINLGEETIKSKKFSSLKPPEMERIKINLEGLNIHNHTPIKFIFNKREVGK